MKKLISLLIRYVPRKYLQRVSGIGLRVMGLFYAGNGVECPICRHHYRTFLPYGRVNPRLNALCPHCQSLERHRLIWLYLQAKTEFFHHPMDVLHIAPEACFMPGFGKQHGARYVTADLESPLAKVKMDIHQMPFGNNSFDVVLCNHVLEHVQDDIQAMREIYRVLRPGGWAILQVPFFHPVPEVTFEDPAVTLPSERERVFGQDDHVRKYGKDYVRRIQSSGLLAEGSDFGKSYASNNRYGLSVNEVLYIATKPK
ncbi:MAG: class I SAM-dependent methyltransferase [Bacteroidetes bacterium]|nr:class I SAM-dependent methyltransferase [Bacteroidota bacterium]